MLEQNSSNITRFLSCGAFWYRGYTARKYSHRDFRLTNVNPSRRLWSGYILDESIRGLVEHTATLLYPTSHVLGKIQRYDTILRKIAGFVLARSGLVGPHLTRCVPRAAANSQANSKRGLRVLMFSPHGHGGWHHYSVALCNALTRHPAVEAVAYLIVFREQQLYGVGSEEHEILDPSVGITYLAPAGDLNPCRKYLIFLRNLLRWSKDRKG